MEDRQHQRVFIFWSRISNRCSCLRSLLLELGWRVLVAKNQSTLREIIDDANNEKNITYCLGLIADGDQTLCLSTEDITYLARYLSLGNSLFVAHGELGSEIGASRAIISLNKLLTNYGIKFNRDCVIRPNPYKLYHPKEVVLEDFVANKGVGQVLAKHKTKSLVRQDERRPESIKKPQSDADSARIVYPQGCTLNVNSKLATIALTSSRWALPSYQPICCLYRNEQTGTKIVALGSASLMEDSYINAEDNKSMVSAVLEFVADKEYPINLSDAKTIEVAENNITPCVDKLIDSPIVFVQESEQLPEDTTILIDKRLFNIDNSLLPEISRAYKKLNVQRGSFSLIKPKLNLNSLELEPANHGFILRKLR